MAKKTKTIGVIGVGVVGEAVYSGFSAGEVKVLGYDKFKEGYDSLDEVLTSDVIFICVPTATDFSTGKQDLSPLEETFQMLSKRKYAGVIVVKSTVIPGTTQALSTKYKLHHVCHNPEFLTAANPFTDFMEQTSIIIGGHPATTAYVKDAYVDAMFSADIIHQYDAASTTEMAKYMHNLFLSTKVSFFNEMYEYCGTKALNFKESRDAAVSVGQIGAGHTKVGQESPEGKPGFSGMCFPKDTRALLTDAKEKGVTMDVLEATVVGNLRRRPDAEAK